jgi:hypothetical protein
MAGRLLAARAPRAASRLPAASFNIRVPPLIRPYPLSPKNILHTPHPHPCRESMYEYSLAEKRIGRPEREILVLMYGYYVFQNLPYKVYRQVLILLAGGTTSIHLRSWEQWDIHTTAGWME